jgi:DNA-binding XRE family transcriptional regulator
MQFTLKELRARHSYTQAQTAEKLGISTQTYNAWEQDISRVRIGDVQKLAQLFNVEVGQIFLSTNVNFIQESDASEPAPAKEVTT